MLHGEAPWGWPEARSVVGVTVSSLWRAGPLALTRGCRKDMPSSSPEGAQEVSPGRSPGSGSRPIPFFTNFIPPLDARSLRHGVSPYQMCFAPLGLRFFLNGRFGAGLRPNVSPLWGDHGVMGRIIFDDLALSDEKSLDGNAVKPILPFPRRLEPRI